jgi:hypothetical protein
MHSISVIIFFLNIGFKQFVFTHLSNGTKLGNIDFAERFTRSRGLADIAGSGLSIVQSFGFLFTAYLMIRVKCKSMMFWYLVLSFSLLFIAVFISGRTGFLMLPFVVLYLFLIVIIKKHTRKKIIFFLGILVFICVVEFTLFRLAYDLFFANVSRKMGIDAFEEVSRWVVGEFIDKDGALRIKTAEVLESHWFVPDSLKGFVVGDTTSWLDRNIVPSDVGYVRMLFGVGIIGMVFHYSLFLLIFLSIILRAKSIEAKLMFLLLTIFLFLTEAKEPFLTGAFINAYILLIFSFFNIRIENPSIKNRQYNW